MMTTSDHDDEKTERLRNETQDSADANREDDLKVAPPTELESAADSYFGMISVK